jgi:hypothetical protein
MYMNRTNLIRLGGLAAMVGGVLFVAAPLFGRFFPQAMESSLAMEAFLVVALLLVPMGMVGFHALQEQRYGLIGRAGFWMSILAPLAVALGSATYLWWGSVFGSSLLWLAMWVGPLGLLVGFLLYGVATLQARVLPRWCGVAFIVALPVALVLSIPLSFASLFIVFGLIWLTLSYVLWSQRVVSAQQPSRVR